MDSYPWAVNATPPPCALNTSPLRIAPTVHAYELDETHVAYLSPHDSAAVLVDCEEFLTIVSTDGQDNSAAIGQLIQPGFRHVR